MRLNSTVQNTRLTGGTPLAKRERNTAYLMELKNENLLFAYYQEAGINGSINRRIIDCHGGWESPTSHIRGTFTGHWLSAAARIYDETKDTQLKAKADHIVSEIARCQELNGDGWAFSIPQKYLYAIKKGQRFWAPQYVCHKLMMGLLDMYLFAKNEQAFEVILGCADWFYRFSSDITRENMDDMMDLEETGGILELWADLYAITQDERHKELIKRYERPRLFNPLYEGIDVITNMHANTTIPEIHGAARAYEVTKDERYRLIVENYWNFAVTSRGTYATGGQTCGEVYSPAESHAERLGETNQEHCTVYNLIRLADYLYRWTGGKEYADYIEQNIHNGIFAQGYWQGRRQDTLCEYGAPPEGLIAYYLPLAAGSQKKWGSKLDDFWCCHCTLVQANARINEYIYYTGCDELVVAQYFPSKAELQFSGVNVSIDQTEVYLGGPGLDATKTNKPLPHRPNFTKHEIKINSESPVTFTLKLRIPWWINSDAVITVNDEQVNARVVDGYAELNREWKDDTIVITFNKKIRSVSLVGAKDTVAFIDGPVLLAGITPNECCLYGDILDPTTMLAPHDTREWSAWKNTYKTVNQPINFVVKPINEIGNEQYTVYFQILKPR